MGLDLALGKDPALGKAGEQVVIRPRDVSTSWVLDPALGKAGGQVVLRPGDVSTSWVLDPALGKAGEASEVVFLAFFVEEGERTFLFLLFLPRLVVAMVG